MYEAITFETILDRMLDRVPQSMDKREGSIIYDALAPAAVELQLMYIELDVILKETFGDTASREYLIRRVKERGIEPFPASKAILKATYTPTSIDIPIGSRFSADAISYKAIGKMGNGELKVECENLGKIGNRYFGNIIPVDYIDGLETIEITELLIPGEDEEDTENLRKRYFNSFASQSYGGNVADYLTKTNSIAGVGSTKVTPVWNGGGTVKLTILNSEYNKATNELIKKVQNIFDPKGDALGKGLAPIGHIVTVDTASEIKVNIDTKIVFEDGYTFNSLNNELIKVIEAYLLELRKSWDTQNSLVVRLTQIESRITGLKGVIDISNTRINGNANNLVLGEFDIPKMGVIMND